MLVQQSWQKMFFFRFHLHFSLLRLSWHQCHFRLKNFYDSSHLWHFYSIFTLYLHLCISFSAAFTLNFSLKVYECILSKLNVFLYSFKSETPVHSKCCSHKNCFLRHHPCGSTFLNDLFIVNVSEMMIKHLNFGCTIEKTNFEL